MSLNLALLRQTWLKYTWIKAAWLKYLLKSSVCISYSLGNAHQRFTKDLQTYLCCVSYYPKDSHADPWRTGPWKRINSNLVAHAFTRETSFRTNSTRSSSKPGRICIKSNGSRHYRFLRLTWKTFASSFTKCPSSSAIPLYFETSSLHKFVKKTRG